MFLRILKLCSSTGVIVLLLAGSAGLFAQDPGAHQDASLFIGDSWPTYNGDYSGGRYSALSQINKDNIKSLKLAWSFQTHSSAVQSTPLEINGIVYFTVPDQVWAVDAKTGLQIWHFDRRSQGDHSVQRGVAYYKNRIYLGTPDAHLICLDALTGERIWDYEIANAKAGYTLSGAPLIVKGRVIVGTSGKGDANPYFVEALDWDTGAVVWKTSSQPALESAESHTWPADNLFRRGGGGMWLTGSYDPTLGLIYWGTGNPNPALAGKGRTGDNLYTCSILAMDAETGAIAWWFQASPHDTHGWDAVETPVLFDAEFNGKPRQLLAQASRNGYFFLLDRKTGEHLLTSQFVPANWASGVDAKGRPVPDPKKEPQLDGALIEGAADGGTNWMAPSFDPATQLFYVNAREGYSYWYLAADEGDAPEGSEGGTSVPLYTSSVLLALDYQTGKVRWRRESGQGLGTAGILTTAGHLLFTGDVAGNLFALDPADGSVLWHTRGGGSLSNGPMTYQVDGKQYVLMGVDSVLYAWSLPSD